MQLRVFRFFLYVGTGSQHQLSFSCPTFVMNAILTYSSIDFLNFIARVFILLVKKDGKNPHYIAVVVVEKV